MQIKAAAAQPTLKPIVRRLLSLESLEGDIGNDEGIIEEC